LESLISKSIENRLKIAGLSWSNNLEARLLPCYCRLVFKLDSLLLQSATIITLCTCSQMMTESLLHALCGNVHRQGWLCCRTYSIHACDMSEDIDGMTIITYVFHGEKNCRHQKSTWKKKVYDTI